MLVGTTLRPGLFCYGEWFASQGDNVIIFAEEIDSSGGADPPQLTIELFQKSPGDAGDGSSTGASIVLDGSATRFRYMRVEGVTGLLRLRFQCSATGDTSYWTHVRILTPIWYDGAAA